MILTGMLQAVFLLGFKKIFLPNYIYTKDMLRCHDFPQKVLRVGNEKRKNRFETIETRIWNIMTHCHCTD